MFPVPLCRLRSWGCLSQYSSASGKNQHWHLLAETHPGTLCPNPLPTPRLQKIIHRNDGAENSCTERDGWCLPKTSDELRDTMSLMIRQTIRSKRPGKSRLG